MNFYFLSASNIFLNKQTNKNSAWFLIQKINYCLFDSMQRRLTEKGR
jgi:hypothetical protein